MQFPKLNLPPYSLRLSKRNNKICIFDPIRKKHLILTPEEWVRQNFLAYLINEKNYSPALMQTEMSLRVNKLMKRCDIVAFNRKSKPLLLVECKAPEVKIDNKTFEQAARYNLDLKVDFLIITNGMQHYCCKMDYANNSYHFLSEIPDFEQLHE